MRKLFVPALVLACLHWGATPGIAAADFAKDIAPIFKDRCLECHGPNKQKAKLRLDQKDSLAQHKDVAVPGKPDQSEMFKRISLPKGDDDIMPPKGDPLTAQQIALIKNWIQEGAHWPDGYVVGAAPAAPTPGPMANSTAAELRAAAAELRQAAERLEAAAAKLEAGAKPEAPRELTPEEKAALAKAKEEQAKAIEQIGQSGVSVRPVALNVDWHEANFRIQGTNITDATLAPLQKVFSLTELNLAGTGITDAGLVHIRNLTNLTTLHLENTAITDAGLASLKNLTKLEYLNLYGTAVSDAGLGQLQNLDHLKKLYLWQTQVTENGANKLKAARPTLEISRGVDLAAFQKQVEQEKKKKEEAEARKKADEEAKKKKEEEAAKPKAEEKK